MPLPIGLDVGWFLDATDARGIARALSAAVRRGAASEPLTVPKCCPSFLRILSDQTFAVRPRTKNDSHYPLEKQRGSLNWAFTIRGHSESRSFEFVAVELFLQIGLGVLDSRERAQGSDESLATCGAGSDSGHRAQMLNYPDSAFRHEGRMAGSLRRILPGFLAPAVALVVLHSDFPSTRDSFFF